MRLQATIGMGNMKRDLWFGNCMGAAAIPPPPSLLKYYILFDVSKFLITISFLFLELGEQKILICN